MSPSLDIHSRATQLKGLGLIFFSTVGYALSAICSKLALQESMPLLHILFYRFAGMALVLFTILLLQGKARLSWKEAARCIAIGAFGDTMLAFTFLLAIDRIGASFAALLLYIYPIFVFLMERMLHRHSVHKAQWVALLLAIGGAILVLDPRVEKGFDAIGVASGVVSAMGYALYLSLISRKVAHIPPLVCSAYIGLGGTLMTSIAAGATVGFALPPTEKSIYFSLTQLFLGTIMPLTFFYAGIRIIGPAKTAIIYTLEPVCIVLLSLWLFGEQLSMQKACGACLVLVAIVSMQLHSLKHKAKGA